MTRPFKNTGSKEEHLETIRKNFTSILHHQAISEYEKNYQAVYSLVHMDDGGEELYTMITSLLEDFILKISSSLQDSVVLIDSLFRIWENFKASLLSICGSSSYMENTYIKEKLKPKLNQTGLSLFKEKIFIEGKLAEKIKTWLITESMKNKTGEVYEKDILKSILGMFIELGLGSFEVYEEVFQIHFFQASQKFYKQDAEEKIKQLSLSNYFIYINEKIIQEKLFCNTVIGSHSLKGILEVIQQEYISDHIEDIFTNQSLFKLIKEADLSTIKRLYEIPSSNRFFIDRLRIEFKSALKALVDEIYSNKDLMKKPVFLIEEVFKLFESFNNVKVKCFNRNQFFETESNLALETALSQNSVIPTFIAIYIDSFLKKFLNTNLEAENEVKLQKILSIFPFIRDKDIFELKHRQFLAQRLLDKTKRKLEEEEIIIKYLKQECGLKFVSKIQGMVNDIRNSSDIESEEFSLKVLTANNWPPEQFLQFNLPESLASFCSTFSKQYISNHSGRRLSYRFNYGSCEIDFYWKRKRTLIGSIYQGCLLLLFNNRNSFSITELLETIGGSSNEMKRHLLGLVKAKILNKTSKGKVLMETDVLSFNENFSGNSIRVYLEVIGEKFEEKADDNALDKAVLDERKFYLDAVIVKIMKMRRTLEHKDLINEVFKFTVGRFDPDVKLIKSRIEMLIQKDYLERSSEKSDVYNYIA
jgi:cullin 3